MYKLLESAYAAFNARNIPSVLALMHPDVDWPNGMEGGRVHGHEGVRRYWTRQWAQVDPHVTPLSFRSLADGRVEVEVRQVVRDLEGKIIQEGGVLHVYSIENGLISRMDIEDLP